jgi:hypothetical protein
VAEDYCDLCDLPLSTCVHGMPAPPPKPARPAAARRTTTTATKAASPPGPRPASRRTDQSAFRPHILAVLRDAGTPLETDEMLLELEIRLDGQLKERDVERAPTGEVRWHTAARAERKAMIDEGLVVPAQPGIWELTDRGRRA